ncbi:MAG TPA: gliding motility-associated C-terminal domain-containing protein [Ferruginibacter sp.]|nr:gliding motility-associated C-terminal domain-containing protein [Ferruginibacter sp.]
MKYLVLSLLIIYFPQKGNCQNNVCSDSSIRIQYSTTNIAISAFPYTDTIGVNYFAGVYNNSFTNYEGLLFGTDWGENILFSKRFYKTGLNVGFGNTIKSPDGFLFSTGTISNSIYGVDYLIVKTSLSGQLIWSKKYRLNNAYSFHLNANFRPNISFDGNNMYVTFYLQNAINYHIISRLDLDGNILWSRSFNISPPSNYINFNEHPIIIKNDTVIFYCQKMYNVPPTQITLILSKLNANTGTLLESTEYFFPDRVFPEIYTARLYNTNTIGFLGDVTIPQVNSPNNYLKYPLSFYLDSNYTITSASYFISPILEQGFAPLAYGLNNNHEQIYLISNQAYNSENYFLITGHNNAILKSRKFFMPPFGTSLGAKTINLDDKENVHFAFTFEDNNRVGLEYARISDLAPSNTLNCFGRDTSIFTNNPITITRAPFTWTRTDINPLISVPVVLTVENIVVEKVVVCKQLSRCDSININGSDSVCKNETVRYTMYKNPECMKALVWNIDASMADIINREADTAITLKFKRSGYLQASVYNCVVMDSLWVTVSESRESLTINKDYFLCPGKTILLQATPGFQSYIWQDNSTHSSFLVSGPGTYSVAGTDSCGNVLRDSIAISFVDTSFNIPASTDLCITDTAIIQLPGVLTNLIWQPTANSLLRNTTLLFFPNQTTTYQISKEPAINCAVTKSITINVKACPEQFFMPNSFTPNNDGLNEFFRPTITGVLQFYHFVIYNRYGQKIFETSDPLHGWDGKSKQSFQPKGGYVWKCQYKFKTRPLESKQGSCLLIN